MFTYKLYNFNKLDETISFYHRLNRLKLHMLEKLRTYISHTFSDKN